MSRYSTWPLRQVNACLIFRCCVGLFDVIIVVIIVVVIVVFVVVIIVDIVVVIIVIVVTVVIVFVSLQKTSTPRRQSSLVGLRCLY